MTKSSVENVILLCDVCAYLECLLVCGGIVRTAPALYDSLLFILIKCAGCCFDAVRFAVAAVLCALYSPMNSGVRSRAQLNTLALYIADE